MTRALPALALLFLSACVQPAEEYPCDCVLVPTDEEAMAMQGFTDAAILTSGSQQLEDGNDLHYYQFDPAIATPAMIAASPAATCGYWNQPVVSSRLATNHGDPDLKVDGSKYLIVICGPATDDAGATQ